MLQHNLYQKHVAAYPVIELRQNPVVPMLVLILYSFDYSTQYAPYKTDTNISNNCIACGTVSPNNKCKFLFFPLRKPSLSITKTVDCVSLE